MHISQRVHGLPESLVLPHRKLSDLSEALKWSTLPDGCVVLNQVQHVRLTNEVPTANPAAIAYWLLFECADDDPQVELNGSALFSQRTR